MRDTQSNILSKDAGQWPTSLLKMSLFHWCCSHILLVKSNHLIFPKVEHWLEMGYIKKWKGLNIKNIFIVSLFLYLRFINFHLPLILAQEECAKINNMLYRPFLGHLSAPKLMLRKSLRYFFLEKCHNIYLLLAFLL